MDGYSNKLFIGKSLQKGEKMNILNDGDPKWNVHEDFGNTMHKSIIRMW